MGLEVNGPQSCPGRHFRHSCPHCGGKGVVYEDAQRHEIYLSVRSAAVGPLMADRSCDPPGHLPPFEGEKMTDEMEPGIAICGDGVEYARPDHLVVNMPVRGAH